MSKAIVGAAELAGAAALMFVPGLNVIASPFLMSTMFSLAAGGIAMEAGAIAQALGSKQGLGITTRTPASQRQIIRGMRRVGGTIVYQSTTGSTHRQYNMAIALATHQVDCIENLYLDGRQVFWSGSSIFTRTRGGVTFGGDADSSNHTGPNGVQYNFGGKVFCEAFYGDQTSAADQVAGVANPTGGFSTALQANDPTWAPDGSGNTPYLAGCTWVYLKIEADAGTFPQFPEIRFTVRGKNDILDPRTGTRGYTSNWALHIADAITDPVWGLGDPNVNQAQLIAAANVCDELVSCAAGSEARYAVHWAYDTGTAPGEAIQHMMPAAAGRLSHVGDEWFIWPAYWQGPSFTFDENALLDAIQWSPKRSISDLANRVTGTYTAANYPYNVAGNLYDSNGYFMGMTANNFPFAFQPTNFPQYAADSLHGYTGDVYLTADTPNSGAWNAGATYTIGTVVIYNGSPWQALQAVSAGVVPGAGGSAAYWAPTGTFLPIELTLDTVLSISQAQRLAKIALLRNRQQGEGALVMSLAAYQMMPADVMQFNMAALGWSDKLLEIAGTPGAEIKLRCAPPPRGSESASGDDTPAFYVEIPINECDPSVYDWDPSTEELTPYDMPAMIGGVNQFTVAVPGSFAAAGDITAALVQPDGSVTPRIKLTWTEPADTFVTNGGSIEIAVSDHGSGVWQSAALLGGQATQYFLTSVVSGQSYDVRIRAVRANGAASAWSEIDGAAVGITVSAAAGLGAPLAPSALVGVALTGSAAAIIVSAFTASIGSASVGCLGGGSYTITGLTQDQQYYVYYQDPSFLGGSITPVATQDAADFVGKVGYFYIGALITPVTGAGGVFRPTTFTDSGDATTSDPAFAFDANPLTYADLPAISSGYPPGISQSAVCDFGGFVSTVLAASKTLTVRIALSALAGSTNSSVYVVIAGTATSIFTANGNTAAANYTFTIASGTDLSTVSVSALAGSPIGANGTNDLKIYDINIQ